MLLDNKFCLNSQGTLFSALKGGEGKMGQTGQDGTFLHNGWEQNSYVNRNSSVQWYLWM